MASLGWLPGPGNGHLTRNERMGTAWMPVIATIHHLRDTFVDSQTSHIVLVVDDERHIVELLRDLLEDEGYIVFCASDGATALKQVERQVPDIVVADVMMPRMSGELLVDELHARHEHLPVILMSAARNPYKPDATFVAKPFDINVMLGLIESRLATS